MSMLGEKLQEYLRFSDP